jgi:hypothetical protein
LSSTDIACLNGKTFALKRVASTTISGAYPCAWATFGGLNHPCPGSGTVGTNGQWEAASYCKANSGTDTVRARAILEGSSVLGGNSNFTITFDLADYFSFFGITQCNKITHTSHVQAATTCSPFLWSDTLTLNNFLNTCDLCGTPSSFSVTFTVTE